jgi:WD40 repeat protein
VVLSDPGVGFTADCSAVVAFHTRFPGAAVEVHNIDTGAVVRDYASRQGDACEPGPGGKFVYLCSALAPSLVEIVRWNPLTGEKLPGFGRHAGTVRQLAVSADEKWVAGLNADTIRLWNLGAGKLPGRATRQIHIDAPACVMVTLALSSDGVYVATAGLAGMGGAVYVGETRTGEVRKIADRDRYSYRELAFHPSRPVLAFSGGTTDVVFWDAAAHSELKRFAWDIGKVQATTFSPDGLRCAAVGAGKVVVWDVDV